MAGGTVGQREEPAEQARPDQQQAAAERNDQWRIAGAFDANQNDDTDQRKIIA